jgi:uroporphyrinogen-III synthase
MRLDWVVLFSPSGSKALDMVISQLGEASKPRIAAIGNTTSKHLKDRGYSVDAVADKPDATSLCKSVVQYMDKGFDSQARE